MTRKVDSLGYKAARIGSSSDLASSHSQQNKHVGHDHGPDCHHHHHDHDDGHDHSKALATGAARSFGKVRDERERDALEGMHGHDHGPQDGPWWKTSKAQLAIVCGMALAAAFALAQILPRT